jgi:steroid 5-alpha reductase family enzyme
MKASQTRQSHTSVKIVGAIAGLVAGYVLWLVAVSIGESLTTVSKWSLAVLLLSGALAVGAVVGGLLMHWRRKYFGAAFAFGLPILPVVLALAVLANIYL